MTNRLLKFFLFCLGLLFTALAVLGLILPLVPTTPFLLVAAWFFIRSSEKAHQWLLSHPIFGPFIRDFRDHQAMSMKSKYIVLILVWGSFLFAVIGFYREWWLVGLHFVVAIFGSIALWLVKTMPEKPDPDVTQVSE